MAIFGCGGHARSVTDVYLTRFPNASIFFIDENAKPDEKILGFPVLSVCPPNMPNCFIAIGDNRKRKNLWEKYSHCDLNPIIAPTAHVSPYAEIGKNVFIGNLTHIGPEAKIGLNTIINTSSIIEHEVVVGSHSHIGPNAAISGRSIIGDLVFIGVGAVVKDSVRIGSEITVGAGAVVIQDILEPGTYVGCPAKLLRENSQIDYIRKI